MLIALLLLAQANPPIDAELARYRRENIQKSADRRNEWKECARNAARTYALSSREPADVVAEAALGTCDGALTLAISAASDPLVSASRSPDPWAAAQARYNEEIVTFRRVLIAVVFDTRTRAGK